MSILTNTFSLKINNNDDILLSLYRKQLNNHVVVIFFSLKKITLLTCRVIAKLYCQKKTITFLCHVHFLTYIYPFNSCSCIYFQFVRLGIPLCLEEHLALSMSVWLLSQTPNNINEYKYYTICINAFNTSIQYNRYFTYTRRQCCCCQ